MKVVHLASSGELGGAELVVLDILTGLREARPSWELELIVPAAGPLRDQAADLGVTVRVLSWGAAIERLGDTLAGPRDVLRIGLRMLAAIPTALSYVFRLGRALRSSRPSIIHAHGFKMQLLAMWARPSATFLVLHLHDYITSRPFASRLLRLSRVGMSAGAAISRSVAEDAERTFSRSMPIHVVYNGIDTDRWAADGPCSDLDRLSGLAPAPAGTVRVGLVATMARWKGHEVFLKAMSLLSPGTRVRGYVIGGSIYRTDRSQHTVEELHQMAARLGLTRTVGFTGFVADTAAAMRALDIVIHASTRPEPFGRVIVEGMATERAVLSTATGGAAELIEEGRSAVAVPSGDPSALAVAIERLASDPMKRRSLGLAGRTRVKQFFDRPVMIKAVIDLYDASLAAHEAAL